MNLKPMNGRSIQKDLQIAGPWSEMIKGPKTTKN